MVELDVRNRQTVVPVNTRWMRSLALFTLREQGVAIGSLSVTFVDNPTIHALNREYLRHDYPTDVITFELEAGGVFGGEIIISPEYADSECVKHRNTVENEIGLYLVHGILHLSGYDDRTSKAAAQMREVQDAILASFLASRRKSRTKPPAAKTGGR